MLDLGLALLVRVGRVLVLVHDLAAQPDHLPRVGDPPVAGEQVLEAPLVGGEAGRHHVDDELSGVGGLVLLREVGQDLVDPREGLVVEVALGAAIQ